MGTGLGSLTNHRRRRSALRFLELGIISQEEYNLAEKLFNYRLDWLVRKISCPFCKQYFYTRMINLRQKYCCGEECNRVRQKEAKKKYLTKEQKEVRQI